MNIGYKIKEYRDAIGITEEELGLLIGKSQQTVSDYEANRTKPSLDTLEKISKHLGKSVLDFFDQASISNNFTDNNGNLINNLSLTIHMNSPEEIQKVKDLLNQIS